MSIQEIHAYALQLPREERAALVRHLIASLEESDEFEQAWSDEAARRLAELECGHVDSLEATTVFADARRRLA
ncbi:MAG: addiction module protein [Bacteroidota bacterium]